MRVEWYGQSAFALRSRQATVFVDPFGDMPGLAARGMRFDHPPIAGVEADMLLVTHEHADHNATGAIGGGPPVLRSNGLAPGVVDRRGARGRVRARRRAGTARGPNTILVFDLDGLRVAHFGAPLRRAFV